MAIWLYRRLSLGLAMVGLAMEKGLAMSTKLGEIEVGPKVECKDTDAKESRGTSQEH